MGTRARVLTSIVPLLLMAACHGPPIMSRIQPRVAPRAEAPRTPSTRSNPHATRQAPRRRADILTAPFLSREGKPASIVTEKMIAEIERAVRLRQEAKRPPADPCSQVIERARRLKYGAGVGREERGAISVPIPCPPQLLKSLLKKLTR